MGTYLLSFSYYYLHLFSFKPLRHRDEKEGKEIRNLTTFTRLNNNGFSLSSFFLSLFSFLWIGAQFPQEKFLSYGRILTLHYYFLLMCILFSFLFLSSYLSFPS